MALIERDQLGGTCVNTGCTPTKSLVASAKAAQIIRRAEEMGLPPQHLSGIDLAAIPRRKDAIVTKSRQGLEKWLGGMKHCTVIHGDGRLVGPSPHPGGVYSVGDAGFATGGLRGLSR